MSVENTPGAAFVARRRCSTANEAMDVLTDLVRGQNGGDSAYLEGQRRRYAHSVGHVLQLCPGARRVLDIGSHYLHQAILLRLLGYEVFGLDVRVFSEAGFIVQRAEMMDIHNYPCDSIESGDFLAGCDNSFDLILFTETLEHITFNPIRFWRRVYELLSDKGIIYITTPNSMRPVALLKAFLRLVTLDGTGITVEDIFSSVTYGHHWKEYSPRELKEYFRKLSPDFQVEIKLYSDVPDHHLKRRLVKWLSVVPILRSQIEAIIKLSGRTAFSAKSPELPMMKRTKAGCG